MRVCQLRRLAADHVLFLPRNNPCAGPVYMQDAAGNRPAMLMKSSDAKSITFDLDKTCGIDAEKESHMHALTINFDDADTVTCGCKAFMEGKEMPDHPTTLKRVKL